MPSAEGGTYLSAKILQKNVKFCKKVDCALMDYTENDAITTYIKNSLSDTHQLPYDHGKFFF